MYWDWSAIMLNVNLEVQTEKYVLCECGLADDIHEQYGCFRINFDLFMRDDKATELIMLHEILRYVSYMN